MDNILQFLDHPFFKIIGWISTICLIFTSLYVGYLILRWVVPVWYRLWIGLSTRKIAVFADNEYASLKKMLKDSKIFREKNIEQMHKNSIDDAKNYSVFLIHWICFEDCIDQILDLKDDATALIVYAPSEEGRISDENMKKLNTKRNVIVVNMRGRLMNDIFTCLITTNYERN